MLNEKKALLLIGSPKVKNSTSESLGDYLLEGLHESGYICESLHVLSILNKNKEELLDKVNSADLIIISFPLYVDSLPTSLIKVFELIANDRNTKKIGKKQSLIAIANSGFPESFHNHTALRICENFANKNNFMWLGGFALGGGAAINGVPIKQLSGGMTRNVVKALDMAVAAVSINKKVPKEAVEIMARNLIPINIYTSVANRGWKAQAKKYKVSRDLYDRPYIKK
ncbi:MAG: NAD(P)H-dependent oxidoreductase [Tissierella sp.]|nr:NAD(P)H-dependent oxidoreductase [Tissierella sp.]